jgi:hypothetical protein
MGLDFGRFRPRALVIEATVPSMSPRSWDHVDEIGVWQAWEPRVLEAGYQFAYFDGLNRFYLRAEDAGLAGRLSVPPSVHEKIEPLALHRLRERLAAVSKDRDAKSVVVDRLVRELAATKEDNTAKSEVVERLLKDLAAVGKTGRPRPR